MGTRTTNFEHGQSSGKSLQFYEEPVAFSAEDLHHYTNNFDEENFLGEGNFGQVYFEKIEAPNAYELPTRTIAVKRSQNRPERCLHEWNVEIQFLPICKHNHIISLVGYSVDTNHRYLVYEYMENMTLRDVLKGLNWCQTLETTIGVARALEFLHNQQDPIVVQDIKSENLLFDEDFNVKLADFGLAKRLSEYGPLGGTCPYNTSKDSSLATYIIAFGMVLIELLTKKKMRRPEEEVLQKKIKMSKDLRGIGCNKRDKEEVIALAKECLSRDPHQPQMHTVVERLNKLKVHRPSKLYKAYRFIKSVVRIKKKEKSSDGGQYQIPMRYLSRWSWKRKRW